MKKNKFCFFTVFFLILASQTLLSQVDYNKLDSEGRKHGSWKGFYEESKRLRYEGVFEHGKEIGKFQFFDDTKAKSIIATREFNSKDNSAYTIFFDQTNNKVSEGKVVNKLFEGPWKYYHQASPTLMTTENYKDGNLQGLRSIFYASGKIAEETNYKNNFKEGVYKKYSENGVVLEESIFKNNEYNGLAVFKDSDGNVVSKGQFVNGKKAGIWQFFEKGKQSKEIDMSNPRSISKSAGN
ncbi:toxin-antitoxin system YwqK family antitoxin [Flavobacterium sp. W22_SRS_FP1]|uniref:toxin-antitoxin system YwqK family antitoxin n=1 Tax=Flavobacterium sp. W22_SRS_FP1 TaxID=3240276 RepID=UPI003F8DFD0A